MPVFLMKLKGKTVTHTKHPLVFIEIWVLATHDIMQKELINMIYHISKRRKWRSHFPKPTKMENLTFCPCFHSYTSEIAEKESWNQIII